MWTSMKRFSLVMALILVVALQGCIKERRRNCPCRLYLDMTEIDTSFVNSARISIVGPDGFVYDDVRPSGLFGLDDYLAVPRGECLVNVYYGEDGLSRPSSGLSIPYGNECPGVYMYSSYVDTDCEITSRKVRLYKNHCLMTVCVADPEHFPFGLSVNGNVSGYGVEGSPESGGFRCRTADMDDGRWTVSVPRQKDDSLVLEVDDGTAVLKSFALGKYISSSGYDWNAPDLEDITIGIDYTRTKLTLSVLGWEEVYEFDVVI